MTPRDTTVHKVSEAIYVDGRWKIECSCGWTSTAKGQDSLLRLEILGEKHEAQNGERRRSSDIRYEAFMRRTYRFMTLIVAWLFVVGFMSVYLLNQNDKRSSDIQAQRRTLLMSSCRGLNERHDKTIRELAYLVAHAPDRKAALASQPGTIALIDAIAPVNDCNAYVKRNVK